MNDRRNFFRNALAWGAGMMTVPKLKAAPALPPVMVETQDIPNLPYTMDNSVKVFHLIAEPVTRKISPFKTVTAWGYNGSVPGPTIQVTQGDRVRVVVENRLPESTTMHWHGFEVPVEMDGTPYISQMPIPPGGRFTYEFDLHQAGTFFYHSHGAMQEMMGMIGMFIMHPKDPYHPRVDHDFGLILQEWALLPGSVIPNTANMEFNWLTVNGVSSPNDDTSSGQAWEPRAHSARQHGDGSSSDPSARSPVCGDR